MLTDETPDPDYFLRSLQPLLEARDPCALAQYLRKHYKRKQLAGYLISRQADVRKAAAMCLGLVGDLACVNCLVETLADPDPVVNQFAENALWNIWFRAAPRAAAELLAMGARCMNDQEYTTAIQFFNQAIQIFPTFAEAYHQRGMAWHLLDRHEDAIKDYHKTLELMPQHFCAWTGLGQCHACLRQIQQALDAFEHARVINPRIEGVSEAIGNLRRLVHGEKK